MHFSSNNFRSISNNPAIFAAPALGKGFASNPARQPMAQGGTLSRAELQRIVADMVG